MVTLVTLTLLLSSGGVAFGLAAFLGMSRLAKAWERSSGAYVGRLTEACSTMLMTLDPVVAGRLLVATTIAGGLLGWCIGQAGWQGVLLCVAGAMGGYQVPAVALRLRAHHRRAKLDEQFAPALVLMASGLQAGLSLPQALELSVRESPSPLADELALVVKEIRLGGHVDDALRVLSRRLPLEDVRMAVDAILTLRQTGGDLVSCFRVIAETVTERRKVEGRIRVITTEGLLQGVVMGLIPPAMLLLFGLTDPPSVRPLIGTPVGWAILAVVGGLNVTGFVVMRRIAKVQV